MFQKYNVFSVVNITDPGFSEARFFQYFKNLIDTILFRPQEAQFSPLSNLKVIKTSLQLSLVNLIPITLTIQNRR